VGLPEPLLSDLKKNAGKHWVFPGRDPLKHHTRQAVWKDVKRAAKLFRLPQNVAPHSFRKVYAVELMQKYGDIERVRRALNHGSETITMIYALADTQMKAKYKRRRNGNGRKKS
jgi:site-specific recombinase XerD